MRFDRAIAITLADSFYRLTPKRAGITIPILMYHSVSSPPDSDVHPYFRTVTSPKTFQRHVQMLHDSGFEVLLLSEAAQLLRAGIAADTVADQSELPFSNRDAHKTAPRPRVVLTFDDGFEDFLTEAFPILDKYGFRATVFLSTEYIGKDFLTGRKCLNAAEVKNLSDSGVEFGSHTASHPQLKDLPFFAIERELSESKHTIEDITGSQCKLFSYPFRFPEEDAAFTQELRLLLIAQGYESGVTTSLGTSCFEDDSLFLKRLPVNDSDDPKLLAAKLCGAYDWLHSLQLLKKKSQSLLKRVPSK